MTQPLDRRSGRDRLGRDTEEVQGRRFAGRRVQSPKSSGTGLNRSARSTAKARRHQEGARSWRFKIRSGHLIDGGGAAGEKIPAGNEKKIPAGDGDPFSLYGEKDPRQSRLGRNTRGWVGSRILDRKMTHQIRDPTPRSQDGTGRDGTGRDGTRGSPRSQIRRRRVRSPKSKVVGRGALTRLD